MAVNFASPSYRAGGSDLTIAISPLGLVELADEEFEVHGPRINRYAHNFAFYLGHHWGYRREHGEPQTVFNYTRALSDYITNFTFGKGVYFNTPKETEAIVPNILRRVWEKDNEKSKVLWEIGNFGGVSGDVFIKVAYEEAWQDSIGRIHPGRVRILPLNPSFCFPEFHPHDRERLLRFKMKYRFWGTSLEGTRQVFTYTEIMTDDTIEEFINDELLDSRPNPLGTIPVTHIPNYAVAGSPWGLSDIHDILGLQKEYNEKSLEISDIINYHSAPVTVITGAKASQLEKGPRKVWGGLPKDAKVFNLGLETNLSAPMAYLEMLKRSMHEMTGVPEAALGQMQPISNTSGVALSIMYLPLMNRYHQKVVQYTNGLKKVNEHILLTIAVKEPWLLQYDPIASNGVELKPGQLPVLDHQNPVTYQTDVVWPPPLPFDVLVKLNELQAKMGLGLESKRGALRELGEEQPDSKAAEIFEELVEDTKEQAALDLLRAELSTVIAIATGMVAPGDEGGGQVTSAGGDGVTNAGGGDAQPGSQGPSIEVGPHTEALLTEIATQAFGTKLPQWRNPQNSSE